MTLTFEPVRIATGHDEDGRLVFAGDRLVTVLVRLCDEHEIAPGRWFYEAGFGPLSGPDHTTFASLEAAGSYISSQISGAWRGV
jgi:hypothetical protein